MNEISTNIQGGRKAALLTGLAAALTAGNLQAQAAPAAQDSPAQMVDALHAAFGKHHARAVHSKGIMLEGSFVPASEARTITKAPLFTAAKMPVLLRFSDFTGLPDIPDTAGGANPRGLALRFKAEGGDMDVVTHSFNGFPTATAAEFAQLLRAIGASGPQTAKPTALEKFLGSHPIARTFLSTQKPAPVSYATLAYYGVNAFRFVDAAGRAVFVRYRFIPVAGEQFLDASALGAKGPNYLLEEIPARVAKGPIAYEWFAQVSASGDAIADPSVAWPESRKLVNLGTIRIERLVADQATLDKSTMFLPTSVPSGIEPADPMLAIRSGAYPISFGERQ